MTADARPGPDVHVRIWLDGMGLDYLATAAAVRNLIDDWKRKYWCTVELVPGPIEDGRMLPRLPCERLFLGP
jgi:hypothetical protein